MQPKDFDLLNIPEEDNDIPYFFGMGLPCKYNCNYGFENPPPRMQTMLTNFILTPELEHQLAMAGLDISQGVPIEIQQ